MQRGEPGQGAVRGAHRQQAGSDGEDGPEGQHPARRLDGAVRPLTWIEGASRLAPESVAAFLGLTRDQMPRGLPRASGALVSGQGTPE